MVTIYVLGLKASKKKGNLTFENLSLKTLATVNKEQQYLLASTATIAVCNPCPLSFFCFPFLGCPFCLQDT